MRPAFVIGGTFQSTLSSRRATEFSEFLCHIIGISIHALLTESDLHLYGFADAIHISIHALLTESDAFQLLPFHALVISIHALLTESDCERQLEASVPSPFQSTLSSRRATN